MKKYTLEQVRKHVFEDIWFIENDDFEATKKVIENLFPAHKIWWTDYRFFIADIRKAGRWNCTNNNPLSRPVIKASEIELEEMVDVWWDDDMCGLDAIETRGTWDNHARISNSKLDEFFTMLKAHKVE